MIKDNYVATNCSQCDSTVDLTLDMFEEGDVDVICGNCGSEITISKEDIMCHKFDCYCTHPNQNCSSCVLDVYTH